MFMKIAIQVIQFVSLLFLSPKLPIIIDYVNDWYKINNYIYLIKYNSNYSVEHHYSSYISFLYVII